MARMHKIFFFSFFIHPFSVPATAGLMTLPNTRPPALTSTLALALPPGVTSTLALALPPVLRTLRHSSPNGDASR